MIISLTPEPDFDPCELYDALWCTGLAHRPGAPLQLSAELDELLVQVLVRFKAFEEA